MLRVPAVLSALLLAAGVSGVRAQAVEAVDAFPGLRFSQPVELAVAPGQPGRLYVVEQGRSGVARIRSAEVGASAATVFFAPDSVATSGSEQGLLGLAFHPDYEANGRAFVSYTRTVADRKDGVRVAVSRIAEVRRSATDPLAAEPASERVVLEVDQPYENHNGGKIAFGPDGMLYVALGDGGSGGDPKGNGQDRSTLLGSILRIDVGAEPYAVPSDNPFVGADCGPAGCRPEIYAYGFRNPWKFSFDAETGTLWAGDVGQDTWEEVDTVRAGGNYGWREVEGPACYVSGCDLSAYEAPVHVYDHSRGLSITGGFVYRGSAVPSLSGRYLFADFVTSRFWSLDPAGGAVSALAVSVTSPSTLNPGPDGEPFVASYGGRVFRLQAVPTAGAASPEAAPLRLEVAGPNPFRERTALRLAGVASGSGPARAVLLDALGREVAGVTTLGPDVTVDGRALAPGIYLVRVEAGDTVATQRLVRTR